MEFNLFEALSLPPSLRQRLDASERSWRRRIWSRRQQIRTARDNIFQAKRRVREGLPARR